MQTLEFSGFGNYSNSFGWDSGLDARAGSDPVDADWFRDLAECVADYAQFFGPGHDTYGIWEDRDYFGRVRGIVLYTLNEHGGSRNVRGYVQAENPAKTMRRFCVDRFPETPYISPEERGQIEENKEYYETITKKIRKALCYR